MTNDKALMMAIKSGETSYLSVLFAEHHKKLFNYFLRMGNNHSTSEDLVQETFIRVLKYSNTYEGKNEFLGWLYRIAKNTAIDWYRSSSRHQYHEPIDENSLSLNSTLEEDQVTEQRQKLFEQALKQLEPDARELIILSRYQQLKYEEIAEMMECNLNTLKTRMRAAIKSLKNEFDELSGASA